MPQDPSQCQRLALGPAGLPEAGRLSAPEPLQTPRVFAVVIPDRSWRPVQVVQVNGPALSARQRLVQGAVGALALRHPAATMYLSREAAGPLSPGGPVEVFGAVAQPNQRASLLARAHQQPDGEPLDADALERIAGPAVIVGRPDAFGHATGAPQEYVRLFQHTGSFQIRSGTRRVDDGGGAGDLTNPLPGSQVAGPGDIAEGVVFGDVFAAYARMLATQLLDQPLQAAQVIPVGVSIPREAKVSGRGRRHG